MPPPPQSIHPTSSSITSSPKRANFIENDNNNSLLTARLKEQLESLQEEFHRLEQSALEVEAKQEAQIQELSSLLRAKEVSLEALKQEHHEDSIKLKERDDEIKYLQVELEASLFEREQRDSVRLTEQKRSTDNLKVIENAIHQYTEIHQNIQSLLK